MIARRYLYGKGLKSPPSTIHTTSEKTVMEMSMVSQDYLRRHNLDTQHDETQFLDIKRINQLPKLPHLC